MAWGIWAAMLFVPVAQAHSQSTATNGGGVDRIELALPVTASVASRCGFSTLPSADVDLGNLEAGFSRHLPFVLECNGPMRLAITSQNGGLVAPGKARPGLVNRLDYTVTLQLVGTGGVSAWDSCRASALTSNSVSTCSFRGVASATDGLRLPRGSNKEEGSYLRIVAPATSGLAASRSYADVLTLTVSPSA